MKFGGTPDMYLTVLHGYFDVVYIRSHSYGFYKRRKKNQRYDRKIGRAGGFRIGSPWILAGVGDVDHRPSP